MPSAHCLPSDANALHALLMSHRSLADAFAAGADPRYRQGKRFTVAIAHPRPRRDARQPSLPLRDRPVKGRAGRGEQAGDRLCQGRHAASIHLRSPLPQPRSRSTFGRRDRPFRGGNPGAERGREGVAIDGKAYRGVLTAHPPSAPSASRASRTSIDFSSIDHQKSPGGVDGADIQSTSMIRLARAAGQWYMISQMSWALYSWLVEP